MKIIFPFNPLNEKEADDHFNDEYFYLKQLGIDCALFDYDLLGEGIFNPKPKIEKGDIVIYRGWMLNLESYATLCKAVENKGGVMLTNPQNFISSHHIVGWYKACKTITPESHFFTIHDDIQLEAEKIGWDQFFVKDYVKSNYDHRGSIARSPAEVKEILDLIKEHRGSIEGGIALRKVEKFNTESEIRYFIFKGKAYGPDSSVPDIVKHVAGLHDAPFYSVDIIERADGVLRLIEIGDGQVSDRKSWHAEVFCKIFIENNVNNNYSSQ